MRRTSWNSAIDRLVQHFTIPLQNADALVDEILAEFDAVLQYATQYISLSTMDYRAVRWRLFHAPSASEWNNTLTLAEMLFPYLPPVESWRESFLK